MAQLERERSEPRNPSAMEELSRDPSDRKRFLRMVGGAGAAGAFSIFLAACGDDEKDSAGTTDKAAPAAGSTAGDLKIVNYALTLEYIEADFYEKVAGSGLFRGKDLALIRSIGENENDHVTALAATAKKLGGTPAPRPKTTFPLEDARSVLQLAATVENLGAAAYLGQAGRIQNKEVLAAALSIHTVEARHASALNFLTQQNVTPDGAFAKPASMEEVLPKVKPFLVS
ncbi:MAG TPA: ferritin-like domain-containing protein [Solirubrobacteraceae bacterium]|nr:ferritin-like domain-containing protein [Solirubrobacteraceae bacterium]